MAIVCTKQLKSICLRIPVFARFIAQYKSDGYEVHQSWNDVVIRPLRVRFILDVFNACLSLVCVKHLATDCEKVFQADTIMCSYYILNNISSHLTAFSCLYTGHKIMCDFFLNFQPGPDLRKDTV